MTPAGRRRPYAPRLPREQRREQLLDAAMTVIAAEEAGRLVLSDPARFTPERLSGFAAGLLAALGG